MVINWKIWNGLRTPKIQNLEHSPKKGTMKRKEVIRHFYIPDAQVKDGVPIDHLGWAGQYIADKRPDVVICGGDFFDMPSLSSYDKGKKSYENRRYRKDVDAGLRAMDKLLVPIHKQSGYKPRMVFTLGNHCERIVRAIEDDPKLEGTIGIKDLKLTEYGWKVYPFLEVVKINGIHYSHFFPSGIMGRPCTTARKIINTYHASCVAGHQQGRDVAYSKRGDGKAITAIIAGSFYQHDETYLTPMANHCWRGCVMLNEVRDGQFDEMFISLDFLKRRYGK